VRALSRLRWRRLARRRAAAAAACRELREALAAPLPDPGQPVRQAPMLAVDLEMTGLDPARDAILSIGWVPLDEGGVRLDGAGEVAIAGSGRSVGESATIHGIRDCDRDGGSSEAEALAALVRAAAGRVTVFHHAPLDLGFLAVALRAAFGIGWLWPWIDTLDWERRRCPEVEERVEGSSRLDAVRERYGLDPRSAHDALADALSCAEVALVLAAHSRARLIDVCSLPGRA
jgi:DNA polymerase-3 subunit epsilon